MDRLNDILKSCRLCPRNCGVNRLNGETGYCRTGKEIFVSSWNLHFGEEPPISGYRGSGTIFFTNCNLGCVFCQNYPISHLGNGNGCTQKELADIMMRLQERGAHNINLVTPTHVVPQIVESLIIAKREGLEIPVVFNSGGYESVDVVKLLEGIVDIYMPDAKYFSAELALEYSNAADYAEANTAALAEMYRQVGDLQMDEEGVAERGMIIRHLVLPGRQEDSKKVLGWIAEKLSNRVYMSIMAQYHPAYKAVNDKMISRTLKESEYAAVLNEADRLGFANGYRQDLQHEDIETS